MQTEMFALLICALVHPVALRLRCEGEVVRMAGEVKWVGGGFAFSQFQMTRRDP